ncbi:MAG: YjjG family noncanonical pyrimidine nucleotidase [Oscillospiraceae bacterium]|nr:YjjG family noncanonical pyrimidine nucleotidase [Oscillospiraceae bacterium]
MLYNCVLLDFDETLVSFKESETLSITKVYNKYGVPATEENIQLYHEENERLWREFEKGNIKKKDIQKNRFNKVVETFGLKAGMADQMNRDYVNYLKNSAILFDGAIEFLEDIEDHVTIAIVTNGIEAVQQNRLKLSRVIDFADGVFTSEKMGYNKPDKRIFLNALKTLGIENHKKVLVVGDNLQSDIKGGINAGLDTCWVNFENVENTTNIKPKYTAYDFTQLKNIILGE